MAVFIVRDVRLSGIKPLGDVIETDSRTPLKFILDMINKRADGDADLTVKIMCHGLPGYLQCGQGSVAHSISPQTRRTDPSKGNGITHHDLKAFEAIKGRIKTLELRACSVAYMGKSPEWKNDLDGFDGNFFCYRLAQSIQANVKASLHTQWYRETPNIEYYNWYGDVRTWGPKGDIIKKEMFPFKDLPALGDDSLMAW